MSILKSKDSFEILRSSAFQNCPYFLSAMHFKGLKIPKTEWKQFCGTPCINNCHFLFTGHEKVVFLFCPQNIYTGCPTKQVTLGFWDF